MSTVDDRMVAEPDVATPAAAPARPADAFMRRLLRVPEVDGAAITGAHRAFRLSLVFTALRCTVTYVLVPILVPLIAVAGVFATPITIALSVLALVNGVVSLRRFWKADHRAKWTYTWFIAVVFTVLIVTLAYEISGLWR